MSVDRQHYLKQRIIKEMNKIKQDKISLWVYIYYIMYYDIQPYKHLIVKAKLM